MNWKEFEVYAREKIGIHFSISFTPQRRPGYPKCFDLVSRDGDLVGDAKYLTLVGGVKLPPAKFMEIAGHVWLLERMPAKRRFLVFGNQKRVAEWWLEKYGRLVQSVEFYFLNEDGRLDILHSPKPRKADS